MADHFAVNTIGPLVLFQATYPLLKASSDTPKFIPITSVAGSVAVGAPIDMPMLAYGATKAALNYLTIKIRADHEGLSTFSSPVGCTRHRLT
jgi:NAD(P)-dependent dehydrogenase (short-subunit alcohol dehydrogenase family)